MPSGVDFKHMDELDSHILVWWDVDMYVGAYKKRRLTARPLRHLERALGHRLRVEEHSRFAKMPEGVWKLEAFNYLYTHDRALAAYTVLHQLSEVSEWFSGLGFQSVAASSDHDDVISSFYWHNSDDLNQYRRIHSAGVMLRLVDRAAPQFQDSHRCKLWPELRLQGRPVVFVPENTQSRQTYEANFSIQFCCNNRKKLIDFHWPRLQELYSFQNACDVEFGPSVKGSSLNEINVRIVLNSMLEHEAVAYCLGRTGKCRFKLGGPSNTIFQAERFPDHEPFDGICAITLKQITVPQAA